MNSYFFRAAHFFLFLIFTSTAQAGSDQSVLGIIEEIKKLNIDLTASYQANEPVLRKLSALFESYAQISAERNKDYNLYKYLVSPSFGSDSRTCLLSSAANSVVQLNDNLVAVGLINSEIDIVNIKTAELKKSLCAHDDRVSALCILSDGHLISGSDDGMIMIWAPGLNRIERRISAHDGAILSITEVGPRTFLTTSADKTIKVWDLINGCGKIVNGHAAGVSSCVYLGQRNFASASWDKTIKIWNLECEGPCKTLRGHTDWVTRVQSLDDQTLASVSDDGSLRIWDIKSGVCKKKMEGHKGWILSFCRLANGLLVTGSYDGSAIIWNPETGKKIERIVGADSGQPKNESPISSIIQLADGNFLAIADDKTLSVFDFYPREIRELFACKSLANNVATIALILALEKCFKSQSSVTLEESWVNHLKLLPQICKSMYAESINGALLDCVVM